MSSDTLQRILYVEDEPDIQAVARMALEAVGGFTLQVCSSGEEALQTAVEFGPDLLLLDVMMPGMDGPTTLQELRNLPDLANTPAVFMTAKVQPQEIEQFKSFGALDVIPKPFDPMTLSGQIAAVWQQRNEQ
jgi:CheY-like chemotaxis protein